MQPAQLVSTYCVAYAAGYESRWIDTRPVKNEFEISHIRTQLRRAQSWLDVGCGTGWLLTQFHSFDIDMGGIDLSPAMADIAQQRCPRAQIAVADARLPNPEYEAKWQLVTCFWGAYALQPSLLGVRCFLRNLVNWLQPGSSGLLSVLDPTRISKRTPVGVVPLNDSCTRWSYIENGLETHTEVFTPDCGDIEELFVEMGCAYEWREYPREAACHGPSTLRLLIFERQRGRMRRTLGLKRYE